MCDDFMKDCYTTVIGGTKGNCLSSQSSSAVGGEEEEKRQKNPNPPKLSGGSCLGMHSKEVYGSLLTEKPAFIPAAPRSLPL